MDPRPYGARPQPEKVWSDVDAYFQSKLLAPDAALENALAASAQGGLPAIAVTPLQGKFLQLLARSAAARRILEIGTLGGYSTIWLAHALPSGGKLITLEISDAHADVARKNLAAAGVADRVDVLVAPAADSLAKMIREGASPFDFIFIDADKASSTAYFRASLALSRAGTMIVVDNVVREGAVADDATRDASALGIRELADYLATEARVSATAVQTVGDKGYDGFILAVVNP
ncbi:MAG: O-methyltransferase [Gemmatimonadaceae bacterium]